MKKNKLYKGVLIIDTTFCSLQNQTNFALHIMFNLWSVIHYILLLHKWYNRIASINMTYTRNTHVTQT